MATVLIILFLVMYFIQFFTILVEAIAKDSITTKREFWINLIPFCWVGYLIKAIIDGYNELD
jgi:hypothetical protein